MATRCHPAVFAAHAAVKQLLGTVGRVARADTRRSEKSQDSASVGRPRPVGRLRLLDQLQRPRYLPRSARRGWPRRDSVRRPVGAGIAVAGWGGYRCSRGADLLVQRWGPNDPGRPVSPATAHPTARRPGGREANRSEWRSTQPLAGSTGSTAATAAARSARPARRSRPRRDPLRSDAGGELSGWGGDRPSRGADVLVRGGPNDPGGAHRRPRHTRHPLRSGCAGGERTGRGGGRPGRRADLLD